MEGVLLDRWTGRMLVGGTMPTRISSWTSEGTILLLSSGCRGSGGVVTPSFEASSIRLRRPPRPPLQQE